MNREILPAVMVGNEFIMPQPRLVVTAPTVSPVQAATLPAVPALEDVSFEYEQVRGHRLSLLRHFWALLHQYSLGAFAIALLIVVASGIQVGASYWSAQYAIEPTTKTLRLPTQPLRGPNTAVATGQLSQSLQSITTQPINLGIGEKSVPLSSETIKSWLKIVNSKGVSYIHVDQASISKSLNEAAAPYIKAPVNQVTITGADGVPRVIATGSNGTKIGDTTPIAQQITQSVLAAKGMQFTLPVETLAYASVTPAAFDKMIEVNVDTKQMFLYDKGQLTRTYLISAGAPITPTPIGQYKIYSKLPIQDMRGFNADGTKYFQPRVRYVSYFLPGGYAIHGNYWRPASWFGNINSSHGCVSLPDTLAKEVYDWAPMGTTVITHH